MAHTGRRILLAVEPGLLEGALASVLAVGTDDEIVPLRGLGHSVVRRDYDAAVVSSTLPVGVRAGVVLTLPDRRGSAGTGTLRQGEGDAHPVEIGGAERVVDLLDRYAPPRPVKRRSGVARWALVVAILLAGRLLGLGDIPGTAASSVATPGTGDAAAVAGAVPDLPSLLAVSPADAAPGADAPATAAPAPAAAAGPVVLPTRPDQWFSPGGRNLGTEALARFLAAVALYDNSPLYVSDTWGRTTGSTQSDHSVAHTDSWAMDVAVRGIQVPTPQTELAAKRVAAALGEANWGGGDLVKTVNGYRFQILWRVPDHFNHVHIGVRKV